MKNNTLFAKSDRFSDEYCCTIVRIGEVMAIPGKDLIGFTRVNGETIVIRKDQVHEGDILFYASHETQLNKEFLGANNLFSSEAYEKNANANVLKPFIERNKELKQTITSTKKLISPTPLQLELLGKYEEEYASNNEFIKKNTGFFNGYGRVKMIKLGRVNSMGFLFRQEELAKYCTDAANVNLEDLVGTDFDLINGELFVKAYVPFIGNRQDLKRRNHLGKAEKRLKRFDRMIEGEFHFHYDTEQLPKYIHALRPDDVVTMDVKMHGTSAIFGKLHVKVPIKLPIHQYIKNKFIDITGLFKSHRTQDYKIEYGSIISSRRVIKNKYINKNQKNSYYSKDIYTDVGEIIYPYLDEGMTLYGEILGYETGVNKYIQNGYDYGCMPGENFLMPYRITTTDKDGAKIEWNKMDVYEWTVNLLKEHPELSDKVKPINVLYHGTLHNLYPDLSLTEHWHENVLERLEKEPLLGMEKNEPLCNNKVPREGIVLRIDNDPIAEAFKLKTKKFRARESSEMDEAANGNIEVSEEMIENYS